MSSSNNQNKDKNKDKEANKRQEMADKENSLKPMGVDYPPRWKED